MPGLPGGTCKCRLRSLLLTPNVSNTSDPQGEFDDWIELYNGADVAIDVGGMYLTDDVSAPTKWRIPLGDPAQTTIAPRGYLLIWADKDDADPGLHATFSLVSASGSRGPMSPTVDSPMGLTHGR